MGPDVDKLQSTVDKGAITVDKLQFTVDKWIVTADIPIGKAIN
ncbi:hypothetical protein [Bacillus massilinigeriensis]|nr:hypothetical protein [Bacillus mediterraneensis]